MSLFSGLVSVSFRPLAPTEIIRLCSDAQLEGIEWGGDVHVPPGDLENARRVGLWTREAGLQVAAYGSYYRCDGDFEPILEAALALEAPLIRVWAGSASETASAADYEAVASDLRRIGDMGARENIRIATEYHGGTLTDTRASCRRLFELANHPNVFSLWQPLRRAIGDPKEAENLEDLRAVLPILSNVHVYNWAQTTQNLDKKPLAEATDWPVYLETLKKAAKDRFFLLEFLPDDDPAHLKTEAAALRALLSA